MFIKEWSSICHSHSSSNSIHGRQEVILQPSKASHTTLHLQTQEANSLLIITITDARTYLRIGWWSVWYLLRR